MATVDELCDKIANLAPKTDQNKPLLERIEQFRVAHARLTPKVVDYDFGDIENNGVRAFVYLLEQFFNKVAADLDRSQRWSPKKRNKLINNLTNFADIIAIMVELVLDTVVDSGKLSAVDVATKITAITQPQFVSVLKTNLFWQPADLQKGCNA